MSLPGQVQNTKYYLSLVFNLNMNYQVPTIFPEGYSLPEIEQEEEQPLHEDHYIPYHGKARRPALINYYMQG